MTFLARSAAGTSPLRGTTSPPRQSERSFQASVVKLAALLGYRWYHTHRSDRSVEGFPDLVLVRAPAQRRSGRVIFAELKAQRTPVTLEQRTWLAALAEAGAEAYLWRPSDIESIVRTLT